MGEGVARTSGWRCASLSCISAHFPKRFWRFFEYFFLFVMGHFFCCHVLLSCRFLDPEFGIDFFCRSLSVLWYEGVI
jgi:hypothetical protein